MIFPVKFEWGSHVKTQILLYNCKRFLLSLAKTQDSLCGAHTLLAGTMHMILQIIVAAGKDGHTHVRQCTSAHCPLGGVPMSRCPKAYWTHHQTAGFPNWYKSLFSRMKPRLAETTAATCYVLLRTPFPCSSTHGTNSRTLAQKERDHRLQSVDLERPRIAPRPPRICT